MSRTVRTLRLTPEQDEMLLYLADALQLSINSTVVLCIEGMYNKVKGTPQVEQMAQMLKDWRKQIQELFPTDYHPEG